MAPLGSADARADKLFSAIKCEPVFAQSHGRLQVVTCARFPQRTSARVLALKQETRDLDLRFETGDIVFDELIGDEADVAAVDITSNVESLQQPACRKLQLPARAPCFSVTQVGPAVAFKIVVCNIDLVADAELRAVDWLRGRALHHHTDELRWEQLAKVNWKIGRVGEIRIMILPPVLR